MANRYTKRRYNPFSPRALSSASNHLQTAASSVYNLEHTGIMPTTGKPSVAKVASRINAENNKDIGLHTKWGQLDLNLR
jgi:hypothetical protein